jgi:flagellar biosynthesis chaperone FliJ
MNSEIPTAKDPLLHKKQMIDVLDNAIDQKKILFKQLMNEIETLNSEIEQLHDERKNITSASAEKSLIDCLY